jgi:hypothetical protein
VSSLRKTLFRLFQRVKIQVAYSRPVGRRLRLGMKLAIPSIQIIDLIRGENNFTHPYRFAYADAAVLDRDFNE